MKHNGKLQWIDVTPENVEDTGFFCYMSRRRSEGYRRKLNWVKARLAEGMRIKILTGGVRGFIEYIPGEFSWRAVDAAGFLLIHCLWIVGRSKGKGWGSRLLTECERDARESGFKGLVMVTSEGTWLAGKKILQKNGFETTATAPPSFSLMVKKWAPGPDPAFTGNWEKKAARFGEGVTIIRTDQCPYIEDAVNITQAAAQKRGLQSKIVEFRSCEEVRNLSPTPFGIFHIVYNGSLLSYHYLTEADFFKRLDERDS